MEKYVIYDVDMHEKMAELSSRKVAIAVIEFLFDRMTCDNIQVQRIQGEGEDIDD